MAKITTSRSVVSSDGTVAIEVKCLVRFACVGALNIASAATSGPLESACDTPAVPGSRNKYWAQSDLNLPAHATRTFGLTLSPCVRRLLSAKRRLSVVVTADTAEVVRDVGEADRRGLSPVEIGIVTLVAS